jgi:hypothetical protein
MCEKELESEAKGNKNVCNYFLKVEDGGWLIDCTIKGIFNIYNIMPNLITV